MARTAINYDELVKDDRVHGRVYTDPAIFDEEMDEIFSRGWVYVGHAGEIPRPGDFRVTDIGRQSVIGERRRRPGAATYEPPSLSFGPAGS
jgi:phenylpropionate dioxygenase-like ring-hydroxylating dioxygenase large terminal subunit